MVVAGGYLLIGIMFFNGGPLAGWLLTACGALIILVGIIANLHVYFSPTSRGLGLVARSLRPRCAGAAGSYSAAE